MSPRWARWPTVLGRTVLGRTVLGPTVMGPTVMGGAVVAASAASATALFDRLGVPSPALFGGLVGGVVVALASRRPPVLPRVVNSAAQAVIGVVLGVLMQLSTLRDLGRGWIPVAAVIAGTLGLSIVAGLLMGRWTSVSPITGSLSLSAGGAAGITSMSADLGADDRMVAVVQYLRVVLIVSTLPLITTFVFRPAASADPIGSAGPADGHWPWDLGFTLIVALGGAVLARAARVPSGTLLGPLVLTAALSLTGWSFEAHPPGWLAHLAYGLVGLRIGLGFTRDGLRLLGRVLPVASALTLAIVVGCAAMGMALAASTGHSALAGYLATSPGGLFAVLSIAAEAVPTEATFVLAVQVLRIFVMLLIAPSIALALSRRRKPPVQPAG